MRVQYPARLAYADTSDGYQGFTLPSFLLISPQRLFGHGRGYVPLSRATRRAVVHTMPPDDFGGGPRQTPVQNPLLL